MVSISVGLGAGFQIPAFVKLRTRNRKSGLRASDEVVCFWLSGSRTFLETGLPNNEKSGRDFRPAHSRETDYGPEPTINGVIGSVKSTPGEAGALGPPGFW